MGHLALIDADAENPYWEEGAPARGLANAPVAVVPKERRSESLGQGVCLHIHFFLMFLYF